MLDRQTLRSIAARSTGAPFQRRRADGSGRPQGAGPATAAGPGATAGTGSLPGERPRVGSGRGGPLASGRSLRPVSCADIPPGDRPEADGRAAFRRQLSGARHGQAGPGARLQPDLGPAAAPQIRSRGAGRVQQKLADRIAATVADRAQGRRLEIWFQDESRIGRKGELTRPSGVLARPLLRRRSIGAAAAGHAVAADRASPGINGTPPPTSLPRCARRASGPPRSSSRWSTPRP